MTEARTTSNIGRNPSIRMSRYCNKFSRDSSGNNDASASKNDSSVTPPSTSGLYRITKNYLLLAATTSMCIYTCLGTHLKISSSSNSQSGAETSLWHWSLWSPRSRHTGVMRPSRSVSRYSNRDRNFLRTHLSYSIVWQRIWIQVIERTTLSYKSVSCTFPWFRGETR